MNQTNSMCEQSWMNPSPDQLKIKLCELIQYYQKQPSQLAALNVVEHIEAFYQHYDWAIPKDQLCAWRTVLLHWRCLAWISHSFRIDNDYHLD